MKYPGFRNMRLSEWVLLALFTYLRAFGQQQAVYTISQSPNLLRPISGIFNGVLSISAYGAKGDATTDNAAITAALSAAQTQVAAGSNAVILFPSGTFQYSQSFTILASNITFRGDNTTLISTTNSNYPLFYASGRSNLVFENLVFDGHYSSGASTGLIQGILNLTGCLNWTVRHCTFQNIAQEGIWMLGGNFAPTITDCTFNNYFNAIFSNWDGTSKAQNVTITNCHFTNCLASTTTDFSGGIKMSGNDGTGINFNSGYVIANNTFYLPGQMGIELNNGGNAAAVAGNTVYGAGFGVSLAGVNHVQVTGNTIQASDQYGIEFAAGCAACTASDNTVNGVNAAGTGSGGIGISITDATNSVIQGGTIGGFGTDFYAQDAGGFVVGLKLDNVIFTDSKVAGSSPLIDLKSVTDYSITNCQLNGVSANTGSFIFLDTTDGSITSGLIANNLFAGSTSSTGIDFYYPGTSNQIKYLQVCGNNTTAVTSFAGQQTIGAGTDLQSVAVRFFDNINNSTTASNFSNCLNVASVQASSNFTASNGWFKWERGFVQCNAAGGAFTVTLPDARGIQNYEVTIQKIDSSGNAITLATTASQTLVGKNLTTWQTTTSGSLASQGNAWTVKSDGANWIIENAR